MDESISQIMEESVEVISERICKQSGIIGVPRISGQVRMLQCTVEPTIDESCAPRERVQQRTAKQIDGAHQFLEEVVEMEGLVPHEQELQLTETGSPMVIETAGKFLNIPRVKMLICWCMNAKEVGNAQLG